MPKGTVRNPGTAATNKKRGAQMTNNLLDRYKNDKELRASYDQRVKAGLDRGKRVKKALNSYGVK